MKQLLFISLFWLCICLELNAQSVLDRYIQDALESNIALKQKEYSYQKSLEAMKETRRMFFPVVSIEAKYSKAQGGRTIEIPFGDMMNPVFDNLNAINQIITPLQPEYSSPGAYPTIDNYTINMLREQEQETKIQLQMPLFNAAIIQNHKIRKGLAEAERINVEIYKRELVKEVKISYIHYLESLQVMDMYQLSYLTVKKNLQSRESLFKYDKITKDEVYAARAQVKEIEKEVSQSNKNTVMAAAYFNFLLNRALEAPITIDEELAVNPQTYEKSLLTSQSIAQREELKQLDTYIEVQENNIKLQKGDALPKVSLGAIYGYQGENYVFNQDHDVAMAGVTLSWNIFSSGQRKARVQQEKINRQVTEASKLETQKKIKMEILDAYYSVETAQRGIDLATEELRNYLLSYDLVEKKYIQGMANYVEYANALNQKVNAQNKLILSKYEYLQQQVVMERVLASYILN